MIQKIPGLSRLRKTCLVLCASQLMTACISMSELPSYPENWSPIRKQQGRICPDISGNYHDQAAGYSALSTARPCAHLAGDCESLVYGLLYDPRQTHTQAESTREFAEQIDIKQPTDEIIEIVTRPEGKRHLLSMKKGDFTCDGDGIHFQKKTASLIAIVGNGFTDENRVFYPARDGSLIMKSEYNFRGHWLILPVSNTGVAWARWTPVSASKQ